ncbi:membrane protein insertase YidC [Sinimarinibacterium flocculans]|uniref:Membrane protein insertase YidC n=1 Tax=Sinimarinibacterium flocculans TaxID=985250 RepID=A0A318E712_9GAMM|nr:membrane protein insertase YidC [Sinimarinibacterium flocculans]PXV64945.1 protein translocase subunit yidC [Sinimarinibacterium flocculans]
MENRRFILIALLGVVLFFMYQAWQKDYVIAATPAPAPDVAAAVPVDDVPAAGDVPTATLHDPAPASGEAAAPGGARISVETDVMRAEIALDGGELRRLELPGFPVSKDQPDTPLALLDDRAGRLFVLQSGLAGTREALVTHHSRFTSAQRSYRLADGAEQLDVVLEHAAPGYLARKIYRFHRGDYRVELIHELDNHADEAVVASPYTRLVRTVFKAGDEPPFVATFTGVGFYEQKDGGSNYRFAKTKLDDLADDAFEKRQPGGWIAMLQHYFVAAVLPPADQPATYSARPASGQGYMAQAVGAAQTIEPGASARFETGLYLGPKLQDRVTEVAPGFDLTLDYGILTPISEPLFWLLDKLHALTGNWGVAIILLTLLVKAAMYKLSEAQYRSMAKMKKFAPKIQDIKERYGDDRERLQKAMMDLYKKEGFNPLAGCWPLLVQFPVFIALYWVLLESVELRQAPFALWLQDLTSPDPYFVLPVLFGVSMFVQQKISGQQVMDPMQQKIMNIMPIMLTAFFAFFQSGLVLYWFTSNLIGIAQQWYITRKLDREEAAKVAKR